MGFEKLRRRSAPPIGGAMRVVPHRPVRRALMLVLLALVVVSGVGLGYWFGRSTSSLEREYVMALETRERAVEARLADLTRELADARLGRTVDAQAAASLRETIGELRSRVATLREEVTFYKSLMAPSSLERGLQIAELELLPGEEDNQFVYRLLLTQAEERRDWVQGGVEVVVVGVQTGGAAGSVEEVLPLTEVSHPEKYPLKFRFRYFQNLTGTVTLPDGFRPRSVLVTVTPGGGGEAAERSFDWNVQAG